MIGTAGAENIEFIRSLGVDLAIDYSRTPFEQLAGMVDFVLDTVGGETLERSFSIVKKGGVLISIAGRPAPAKGQQLGIRVLGSSPATRQDLIDIAKLADDGRIRTYVQRVYPLHMASMAHERSESGHGRGRIVLNVADA